MGKVKPDRWQPKFDALKRLAEHPRTPPHEADAARRKLALILEHVEEAKEYEPAREFMMSDIRRMRKQGISTDGSWTGGNLTHAIRLMEEDYRRRLEMGPVLPIAAPEEAS